MEFSVPHHSTGKRSQRTVWIRIVGEQFLWYRVLSWRSTINAERRCSQIVPEQDVRGGDD
jgi:hypothetical protein